MYPIFFSVSKHNLSFAEEVWAAFPDDWAYLYSKTGRQGAHMWDEIGLQELPNAKVIVVFWSACFPTSPGCVREIIQASSLYRSGALRPVIIRLDDYPLFWQEGMDDSLKPVFEALKPLADYRATEPQTSIGQAKAVIGRTAEHLLQTDHPRMPRHDLVKALRQAVQRDRFTLVPACWISGFNGVGRESVVRDMNRDLAPNALGTVIKINEATLPRQLLLEIESEAFGADRERLLQIYQNVAEGDIQAVADAVERVYRSGNYLILRHGRIVQEEVELPEWLDDMVALLKPCARPKIYFISQVPLTGARLVQSQEYILPFRIQTVDEQEMIDFSYPLIGHFDVEPSRWPDDEVVRIARAAGGNIGFLVTLIRSASRIKNFDHIDALLTQENARMTEAITTYARWAFSQLREHPDERKTLLFLNDISPCHILDLEAAIQPAGSILRVLGRLIDLGLVERETDEIYHLTPLLANRMSRDLVRPELVQWMREAQKSFASRSFDASVPTEDGGHEFVRLEARIQAALLSGEEPLPDSLRTFVSASHWFYAGIRLYHAHKLKPAYRLLRKAYENRNQFRDVSRIEIDRYFCLSATRMRNYPEAELCITRLNADNRSRPIAAFLTADLHEYKGEFPKAVTAYDQALELNRGKKRRQEFIYRPMIRCMLALWKPDFGRAETLAKSYVALKRTVFSLSSLARVYLHWKNSKQQAGRQAPEDVDILYRDALRALEVHPGAGAAPFELYAEEAKFTGDFETALENMDQAIRLDPERFQLRAERWRLMAVSGHANIAAQAIRELDAARRDRSFEALWSSYIHSLAETYVRALLANGQRVAGVNSFAPELQQTGELGQIIARSRRQ